MTNEEVLQNLKEALRRILPSKLVESKVNGAVLQAFMLRKNLLPATPDNFVRAIRAIPTELDWEIPPSNLVAAARNSTQTVEETLRLFDEYSRGNYAPKDLIMDAENAATLLDFAISRWGIISISYLIEGEKLLGSKLKRIPQPSQAELAAKSEAKMHRDWLASLAPQKTLVQEKMGQDRLDAGKRAMNEKELKSINSQIENEVGNFSVGHASGHQDYSRTDSGKEILRSVRDKYPRNTLENAKACLSAVRVAKSKL